MVNFEEYYLNQSKRINQFGGGSNGYLMYKGEPFQSGYGLGNAFKSIKRGFKWLLPIIKTHAMPALTSGAKFLGNELVKSAANIANDTIIKNLPVEESIKERANESIENISQNLIKKLSGGGSSKRKLEEKFQNNNSKINSSSSSNNTSSNKKSKKIRKRTDIFDYI